MKIAIECNSILLEKALFLFLKQFVVPLKQCDFVVSDYDRNFSKPTFFIGTPRANITKPFSKEMLFNALKEFYALTCKRQTPQTIKADGLKGDKKLEEKIEQLTQEFRQNLILTIKAHYEK